jgi:RsiW-degrading membrane proteinase PrsW (M82 family)
MNNLKKTAGLLWMALAAATVVFMLYRANLEIGLAVASGKPDEMLNQRMFWFIVIPIFTPIMAGLALFGWYAWRGEYKSSE